jgi:hypothetical protein
MEAEMQQLLMDHEAGETFEPELGFPRLTLSARGSEPSPKPLWLTAAEAELLLSLCFASPSAGGPLEAEFFAKLGRFVRSFSL